MTKDKNEREYNISLSIHMRATVKNSPYEYLAERKRVARAFAEYFKKRPELIGELVVAIQSGFSDPEDRKEPDIIIDGNETIYAHRSPWEIRHRDD